MARVGAKEATLLKTALRLITWQAMIGLIPVVLFAFFSGTPALFAAFYGLTICLITNFIFAILLFRYSGAQAMKQVVRSLYLGEVVKYSITLVMFWAAVEVFHLAFLPLITSYIQ